MKKKIKRKKKQKKTKKVRIQVVKEQKKIHRHMEVIITMKKI